LDIVQEPVFSEPHMRILVIFSLLLISADALAYIGPGAGISFLGSLWAVIVGVLIAFFAILAWPARVLWRRWKKSRQVADASPSDNA
jgi:uncharacterized membrane protein